MFQHGTGIPSRLGEASVIASAIVGSNSGFFEWLYRANNLIQTMWICLHVPLCCVFQLPSISEAAIGPDCIGHRIQGVVCFQNTVS